MSFYQRKDTEYEVYIYIMEYYLAVKDDIIFSGKWMKLEAIILREVTET